MREEERERSRWLGGEGEGTGISKELWRNQGSTKCFIKMKTKNEKSPLLLLQALCGINVRKKL